MKQSSRSQEDPPREFLNPGFAVVNQPPSRAEGPVVVVGAARGGTSMLSGVLGHLGIFLGEGARPPVYEEIPLSQCFESADFAQARAIRDQYNARGTQWAWKRPSAIRRLDKVEEILEPKLWILVYRDAVATALRRSISDGSDLRPVLSAVNQEYEAMNRFLVNRQPPALLVSYDTAVRRKEQFLKALVDYLGVEPTGTQLEAAAAFIRHDPPDYLNEARRRRIVGFVDAIGPSTVRGWARRVDGGEPVDVAVLVDGDEVGSARADGPRADLAAQGHGACAFEYRHNEQFDPDARIQVQVVGDTRPLSRSVK